MLQTIFRAMNPLNFSAVFVLIFGKVVVCRVAVSHQTLSLSHPSHLYCILTVCTGTYHSNLVCQNIQHGQNVSCSISVRKVRICPLRARISLNTHIFHTLVDCVVCWRKRVTFQSFETFFIRKTVKTPIFAKSRSNVTNGCCLLTHSTNVRI